MWWLLFVTIVLLILGTAAWGGYSAAIWVPARGNDPERAVTFAGVSKGDVVYDLGCGDGRVVAAAAALGARSIGYEISILPFILAKIRQWRADYGSHMRIQYKDLWKADISDATIIYVYLLPESYDRLIKKVTAECQPGTILITYVWALKGREADAVSEVKDKPKVWRYVV